MPRPPARRRRPTPPARTSPTGRGVPSNARPPPLLLVRRFGLDGRAIGQLAVPLDDHLIVFGQPSAGDNDVTAVAGTEGGDVPKCLAVLHHVHAPFVIFELRRRPRHDQSADGATGE